MSGIVVASVFGGIGNQLFCWAAAHAAAQRSGLDFAVERSSFDHDPFGRSYLLPGLGIEGLRESPYSALESLAVRGLTRLADRNRGYIGVAGCIVYTDPRGALNRVLLERRLTGRCYLRGYWQSDRYFREFRGELRQAVKLQPCSANPAGADEVCVHIRSYKEETAPSRVRLEKDYYHAAYARCRERLSHPRFVVYSDDLQWAKAKDLLPAEYEPGGNEHAPGCNAHDLCDLVAMSRFQNLVIANSSFSWWAAYLGDAGAWVQAPAAARGCWSSEDPLPAEWDEV